MTDKPVLIAGAGVAGLTAACAFARRGVPVIVAERRTSFAAFGAGIQLSPNATSALKALGLAAAVARQATAPERLDVRRWGEPRAYAGMAMQAQPEPDGAPFWTILRADLITALLDEARLSPGVRLLVNRQVTAVTPQPDGVRVTLTSDKGAAETVDAVLGVRGCLGDARRPEFLGYEAWRALVPAASAPQFMRQPAVHLWLGRGMHAVHYPVSGGAQINLVLIRAGQDASDDWDRAGDPAALSDLKAAAAQPLRDLLGLADNWRVWSMFDLPKPNLGKGRVALIGDAAHPVLPFMAQGAALAIEDAAVLASLAAPVLLRGEDPSAAVASFAKARARRAAKVQDTARGNARLYHAGKPLSLMRDVMLQRLGPTGMRKRYGWLYGWRMD
jgi:salicylate hydroxylase